MDVLTQVFLNLLNINVFFTLFILFLSVSIDGITEVKKKLRKKRGKDGCK